MTITIKTEKIGGGWSRLWVTWKNERGEPVGVSINYQEKPREFAEALKTLSEHIKATL